MRHAEKTYLQVLKKALNGYLQLGGDKDFTTYTTLNKHNYDTPKNQWRLPAPARPYSLLTSFQFDNLEELMLDTIKHQVPGDYIEAGVCRGGAVIFMRALLKAYAVPRKNVWVADSFAGIPLARDKQNADGVDAWTDRWVADLDAVKANFRRFDMLDDRVKFLKGYFHKTLPKAPIRKLALIRLDADSYESTKDALTALYPKLSPGGYVIIDDFHLPGCMRAVHEYRARHGIDSPFVGTFSETPDGARELREVHWQAR